MGASKILWEKIVFQKAYISFFWQLERKQASQEWNNRTNGHFGNSQSQAQHSK